jgi:phosphopantetheinyl transferase (holo-ACP synthase)
MGDWDDSEEEVEEPTSAPQGVAAFGTAAGGSSTFDDGAPPSSAAQTSAGDPFAGEDEDSDGPDAWDDSEEEPEPEAEGPKVGIKEQARLAREKSKAKQIAALRQERMELARRAGRFAAQEAALKAASLKGIIGDDGVEKRTDPSDGNDYTYTEFEEAYGPRAEELWMVAVQLMHEKAEAAAAAAASGDLGEVQQDSDTLFGDDGDFYGDGDDGPEAGPEVVTVEGALSHQLITPDDYQKAGDAVVQKFEQLIVSDNFVPFLAKFCKEVLKGQSAEEIGATMKVISRLGQQAKSSAKGAGGGSVGSGGATAGAYHCTVDILLRRASSSNSSVNILCLQVGMVALALHRPSPRQERRRRRRISRIARWEKQQQSVAHRLLSTSSPKTWERSCEWQIADRVLCHPRTEHRCGLIMQWVARTVNILPTASLELDSQKRQPCYPKKAGMYVSARSILVVWFIVVV